MEEEFTEEDLPVPSYEVCWGLTEQSGEAGKNQTVLTNTDIWLLKQVAEDHISLSRRLQKKLKKS